MKIDRRIKYRIVLDTETTPCSVSPIVDPTNMFVYDIGWVVTDKHGHVYETRSYVNKDIYVGEKNLMESAYYANKLPQYEQDIQNGSRILTSLYAIREQLKRDIEQYNITEIYAHNARFDLLSLNNTQRWLTKSKYRYFFPYGVTICDTLKMARAVLSKMPTYRNFCQQNGYITKNKRLRYTAEIIYQYILKDTNFTEKHTGLEDVMIEKEIMAYLFRQHKKMSKELFARA